MMRLVTRGNELNALSTDTTGRLKNRHLIRYSEDEGALFYMGIY